MDRARLASLGAVGLLGLLALGPGAASGDRAHARQAPVAKLNAKHRNRLVLTTPTYRLNLSKDNGTLIELVDRRTGTRLLSAQSGCMWGLTLGSGESSGGCVFGRTVAKRFSYRWAPRRSTLTLEYEGETEGHAAATVTIAAAREHLDLRLALRSDFERPIASVLFPADLTSEVRAVRSVYTPTFLPGIRLLPSFFDAPRRNVERYPSRWAFADLLAADVGRSHVALYTVNPAPSPIAPVDVGVVSAPDGPCGGNRYCLTHAFQTWVEPGQTWTSPLVRMRVGGSVEQSTLAYREENGIDDYPSVESKLGPRLETMARAPLVKVDPWKGPLPRFPEWGPYLNRLPSPSLLHPVAFQERGHDEDYPDFLPPDPRWGTLADFNSALVVARRLGHIVMPYLNVSWWDTQAPTVRALPAPLTPKDIAMQSAAGQPVTEQFGSKDGYVVSPHVPVVRDRVARLMEEWRDDAPVECLFFDQIGARPWRRDFNPGAPGPLAYQDGWIETFSRYRDRCLTTEDGWDRLADAFVGFHGGVLQMQREFRWPDLRWGVRNWEPFPLATWLLHDKVLMYQHDLYEGTFTDDPEALLFNVAFGLMLSYTWDGETGSLDSPWLQWVGAVQQKLGPHVAGRPLTAFRRLTPSVTESVFGEYSVVANWNQEESYDHDGHRIAPLGFLARDGDEVLAGVFGDTWIAPTISGS